METPPKYVTKFQLWHLIYVMIEDLTIDDFDGRNMSDQPIIGTIYKGPQRRRKQLIHSIGAIKCIKIWSSLVIHFFEFTRC